jgi:hypothetical protein
MPQLNRRNRGVERGKNLTGQAKVNIFKGLSFSNKRAGANNKLFKLADSML